MRTLIRIAGRRLPTATAYEIDAHIAETDAPASSTTFQQLWPADSPFNEPEHSDAADQVLAAYPQASVRTNGRRQASRRSRRLNDRQKPEHNVGKPPPRMPRERSASPRLRRPPQARQANRDLQAFGLKHR